MEMEEREAIQELLKRIPEKELKDAVGGLSKRNREIITAASVFFGGALVGVGGKLAFDRWGSHKEVTKQDKPGVPTKPASGSSDDSSDDELRKAIIDAYKGGKAKKVCTLFQKYYKEANGGKEFVFAKGGSKIQQAWDEVKKWDELT